MSMQHHSRTMLGYLATCVAVATLTGCPKDKEEATSQQSSSSTTSAGGPTGSFRIEGTPQTATASATASPSASASATAVASAAPSATGSSKAAPSSSAAKGPLKPAAAHYTGKNFTVDAATPGCKAGNECTMTLKLAVTGDYHVNKEYPYKFVAKPGPVDFLGKGDANVFSRQSGDFKEDGEKAATLTVRFKAKQPGDATLSGTYKLSVCSADNCQIEQQPVTLTVPVM